MGTIGFAGIVTMIVIAPNSFQMLSLFGIGKKRNKMKSVYATIKRMQRQRLIDISEKGGKLTMTVTEAGKKKLLIYGFEDMQIKKPQKWDKRWRIVGFDIPEKQKKGREALRNKLRELEFLPLQKSFFVYPYECRDEIDFIGEVFEIRKYITFIEAISISNEEYFKNEFKL